MSTLLFWLFLSAETTPRVEARIVVTGERLEQPASDAAAAVTVLGRDRLQSPGVVDFADALRLVPGLQVVVIDGVGTPMISSRGFFGAGEVEYLQLNIDAVPASDVESGNAQWHSIDIAAIDRAEILRGAGSSMFGDVALGGVVQLFRRPRTRASLSAGSFESLRLAATFADDRVHGSIAATDTGGFRAHSAGREINGSGGLRAGAVRFTLDVMQRRREEPGPRSAEQFDSDPFGSDPLFRFDRDETERLRVSGRVGNVVAYAHGRESETIRTLLLAPGIGDRALRRLDSSGLGINAAREWHTTAATRLAAGADFSRDSLSTSYFALDGVAGEPLTASRGHRLRTAAFVSAEWRTSPRLRVTAGARWDRIADDFASAERTDALSPRIGAAYELRPAVTAWLNISRSFQSPTLEQRFDPRPFPDFAGGTFTISNAALLPQTATTFEAGTRGGWWEIVAYDMRVEDEIDFDLATFRYANIGRSLHRGVELAARGPGGSPVQPGMTYTWTRVEPLEGPHRGRQLKNIAEHLLRGWLRIRTPLDLSIAVEHARGRFLDDANEFPLSASTVVDVAISRPLREVIVALQIRNLFDERYAPLGFSLGEPYYFPGTGRSLTATVSWQPENGVL